MCTSYDTAVANTLTTERIAIGPTSTIITSTRRTYFYNQRKERQIIMIVDFSEQLYKLHLDNEFDIDGGEKIA